jgi:hypothetical protein
VIEFTPEIRETIVKEFDEMKMVKDMHRLGKVSQDGSDIGRGQVGGHGFDVHLLPSEDFPEPFQSFGTFALADINDGTTFQVKHDGQVAMAFANGDFIDGDLLKFMVKIYTEN